MARHQVAAVLAARMSSGLAQALLHTQVVSTPGSCGATSSSNDTRQGSTFGNCCSTKGYCGCTDLYCSNGCQSGFGTCGTASTTGSSYVSSSVMSSATAAAAASSTTEAGLINTSGSCGSYSVTSETCLSSTFGSCCSKLGYCGGNSSYCTTGLQSRFESYHSTSISPISSSSTSSSTITSTKSMSTAISTSGSCSSNSLTSEMCTGSTFGSCCGGDASYCGPDCQSFFGLCGAAGYPRTTSNTITTNEVGPSLSTVLSAGVRAGVRIGARAVGLPLLGLVAWYVRFHCQHWHGSEQLLVNDSENELTHGASADARQE